MTTSKPARDEATGTTPAGAGRAGEGDGVNLAVVIGRLSRPASCRILPSGDHVVALEVSVREAGGRADTVPVSWPGAPAWAEGLDVGDAVTVVGRVRRRFFRAGVTTASRTEVVAGTVVRSGRRARAAAVVREAAERLADRAESAIPGAG